MAKKVNLLRGIEKRGEMRSMGVEGDRKQMWSKGNADEVDAAKAQYEKLIAKGFKAYSVKNRGGQGKQLDAFDVNAERIILVPPIGGG